MKKFMNDVDGLLGDSLRGFAAAHADIVVLDDELRFVRRRQLSPGKVALISGGGSGHEPLHTGFVGKGMLDAACPGQIFTSPTPDQMLAAMAEVDSGAGTLLIIKNYEGDQMNFGLAADMAPGRVERVVTNDDMAVEDSTFTTGRRGVAGTLVVEKVLGAAAEQGMALEQLRVLGDDVNARTRSLGVALTSGTVPAAGRPTFELGGDEMEFGVGIHGEPGRRREQLRTANDIATEIAAATARELKPRPDDGALLFVNGFGATPLVELYLMYRSARQALEERGFTIARSLIGSYVTSLDMAGCSITTSMLTPDLLKFWDAPVLTPALRWDERSG